MNNKPTQPTNPEQQQSGTDEGNKVRSYILRKLYELFLGYFKLFIAFIQADVISVLIVSLTFGLIDYLPLPDQIPSYLKVLLTILFGILTGVVGARLSRHLTKEQEGDVLQSKGRSAIRALRLLSSNIEAIQFRVRQNATHDEILNSCSSLQGAVQNAMEEWQDIIPELAGLPSSNEKIRLLEKKVAEQAEDLTKLDSLEKDLQSEKEQSNLTKEQLSELQLEKANLTNQLKQSQSQLRNEREKASQVIGAAASSYSLTGAYPSGSTFTLNNLTQDPQLGIPKVKLTKTGFTICRTCTAVNSILDSTCTTCGSKLS